MMVEAVKHGIVQVILGAEAAPAARGCVMIIAISSATRRRALMLVKAVRVNCAQHARAVTSAPVAVHAGHVAVAPVQPVQPIQPVEAAEAAGVHTRAVALHVAVFRVVVVVVAVVVAFVVVVLVMHWFRLGVQGTLVAIGCGRAVRPRGRANLK